MAKNWWDLDPNLIPSLAVGPYPMPGSADVIPGSGMGALPMPAFAAIPATFPAPDTSSFSGRVPGSESLLDRAPLKPPFLSDQAIRPTDRSAVVQWASDAIRNGADPKAVRAQLNRFALGRGDSASPDPFSDPGPAILPGYSGRHMPDQLGPGRPQFNSALAQEHELFPDPNLPHSTIQTASAEYGIDNSIADRKSSLTGPVLQPDDRPEDPFTHMMAADERAADQPHPAVSVSKRFDPYSEANLTLGPNEQYRGDILSAARFYHLTPHALAATIGSEMLPGRWNPNAVNGQTHATGLSQFTAGTWIGEANRQGSFLNGVARNLGYLDDHGHLTSANSGRFLALRNNPRFSVWAAADYAAHNLSILRSQGYVRDESPAALARYAYLAHHEGLVGAQRFLRGERNVDERTFLNNVGRAADRARYLAAAGNDRNRAYRDFQADFVDRNVDVTRYMINRNGVQAPPTRTLYR
jgi:hypothetical protein